MITKLTLFFLLLIPKANAFIFGTPILSYLECHFRFISTGFDFGAFDKYEDFFDEDSVMRLVEAGVYVGPKSIKEYMWFQEGSYSPYFFRNATLLIENTVG